MSKLNPKASLTPLLDTLPQKGQVMWIGLRTKKRGPIQVVNEVQAARGSGLVGDRYSGKFSSKRQVTLIQGEHIDAVGAFMEMNDLAPTLLRRNIVVRGINLLALKNKTFSIGDAMFEMTGLCHPCSRMEEALGAGGYNAMRGHGGITARVLQEGLIRVGDAVQMVST